MICDHFIRSVTFQDYSTLQLCKFYRSQGVYSLYHVRYSSEKFVLQSLHTVFESQGCWQKHFYTCLLLVLDINNKPINYWRQLTAEDKQASLKQEKAWLKLRQLILRSLASATYLIPVSSAGAGNTPTNNCEGPSHDKVLSMLIDQLERYLTEMVEDPITHRKVGSLKYTFIAQIYWSIISASALNLLLICEILTILDSIQHSIEIITIYKVFDMHV